MIQAAIKVIGIVCSPRKGGNTEILVREALAGAEESQAQTELITLGDKAIRPCDGCLGCYKTDRCHIKDDMQAIYPKLLEADGVIFGSPVYYLSVTGQAKVFMDRNLVFRTRSLLRNKVGGIIAIAGVGGQVEVRNTFYNFFTTNHMIIADFVQGFAREKSHIKRDRYACLASRELGKKVVSIVRSHFFYPEAAAMELRHIMRDKYGMDGQPIGRFDVSGKDVDVVARGRKVGRSGVETSIS